jgi:hypothetical protein
MIVHWHKDTPTCVGAEEDEFVVSDWNEVTCFDCLKSSPYGIGNIGLALKDRYDWKQVKAPMVWRPETVGQELIGYYAGRTKRDGQYGQYETVLVLVPEVGAFTLSGTKLIQLVDASQLAAGDPVRIMWGGYIDTANGRQMKDFQLFISEGEPLADKLRFFHREVHP